MHSRARRSLVLGLTAAATLLSAAQAGAQLAVQVQDPFGLPVVSSDAGRSYFYISKGANQNGGQAGFCYYGEEFAAPAPVNQSLEPGWYGGHFTAPFDGDMDDDDEGCRPYAGDPTDAPVPPSTQAMQDAGAAAREAYASAQDPASALTAIVATVTGTVTPLIPPAPAAGETCRSSEGGVATCVYSPDRGQYLLTAGPGTGDNELGVCTDAAAGDGYYGVWGNPSETDGDGSAGDPCPAQGPPAAASGPAPPPDRDGDGVADSGDRCPTTAASTSDGCPAQSDDGSESAGTDGSHERTGEGSAEPPPPCACPADPPEVPRVDITRSRLAVSRTARTTVPLQCETERTACRGVLRLTATRRTSTGRRVRVLLARAEFLVQPGQTVKRKVRLTRAGRRMLAASRRVRATAKTSVASASGPVVRRERVVLRRR